MRVPSVRKGFVHVTLGEDDCRVGGLETVLFEAVQTVPHPHRTPNATVNLLLDFCGVGAKQKVCTM